MNTQNKPFIAVLLLITTVMISPGVFGWGDGGSYGGDGSYGDGSSSGWTHGVCRVCHVGYAAEGVLPLPKYNADNHHKLVGKKINHKTAPNWDKSDTYNCLICHVITRNEQGFIDTAPERDCLNCHDLSTVTGYRNNRHMGRNSLSCSVCHCRMPSPGNQFGSCSDSDGGSWGGR